MLELISKGLLLDLDGVLVDSTPAVARVWTRWAVGHGLAPDEVVRLAHGRPSVDTIRSLLPGADPERENQAVLLGELEDTEGVVPLPGARELIRSLPSSCWAIVTSCARPLAEVRLAAAGLPLPVSLVTADDITLGKPDPEPYIKGARLLGLSPSDCAVFEDAPAGIRSGKAAGAWVVALRTTASDRELDQAGADWILSSLSAVSVVQSDHDQSSLTLRLAL